MIKEVKTFFKENYQNREYIWKLAVSSAKADTKKTTLGMYWDVFRDLVFFVTYGLFIYFIRGSRPINGIPVLAYLFSGLVAWYLIQDTLNNSVKCILKNKGIFTKIKFPIMAIPTIETIALYLKRWPTFFLLILIFIVFHFTGYFTVNINFLALLYVIVSFVIFTLSFSLFMSGFFTISKDFRELYKALVRIQFYFVPIFWSVSEISKSGRLPLWVGKFIPKLPFVHLVESFRNAITKGMFPALSNILVFWVLLLIMFLLGCYIQYRLRKIYSDFV